MTPTPEPVDAPSTFWTWRGQSIHYRRQGNQGEPILLIHGFGASTNHWRKNIPDLAQHHQVFAIDLLGFGRSAKPNWIYRTDVWRDQVRDFCQQVVRQPMVVVGNSLGGYVALSFAADCPEWTRGVVLLNGAGSFSSQKPASLWQQCSRSLLRWGLSQKVVSYPLFYYLRQPRIIRQFLQKVYFNPEAVTDQLVEDIYRPSCDTGAAEVFAALMRAGQKGRPVEDLLRSLVKPLLLIWGEKDPWTQVQERSHRYRSHYHPIEEHFLPAGHCPHDELPRQVNRLILQWIEAAVLHSPVAAHPTDSTTDNRADSAVN